MSQSDLTKICKNCEHYRVTRVFREKVCTISAKWQSDDFLVTGKLRYAVDCLRARSQNSKCGQDATHFQTIIVVP